MPHGFRPPPRRRGVVHLERAQCGDADAQLEELETVNSRRMAHWLAYRQHLQDLASFGPPPDHDVGHNAHIFYLLLPSERGQESFISTMRKLGINTPFPLCAATFLPRRT